MSDEQGEIGATEFSICLPFLIYNLRWRQIKTGKEKNAKINPGKRERGEVHQLVEKVLFKTWIPYPLPGIPDGQKNYYVITCREKQFPHMDQKFSSTAS